MPEYQNIFTQVQVQGTPEMGMDDTGGRLLAERAGTPGFSKLLGWLGNAQLGPINLGMLGVVSLASGLLWFFIVGFNMLAQVGWSIPEFLRQLFWLALEPPGPEYGLSMPPLNDGGWYIISSFFLLVAVLAGGRAAISSRRATRWASTCSGPSARRSGCFWCWASSARS